MSDKQPKNGAIFSEEDAEAMVKELGFKSYTIPDYSWYERLKCRLMGPHDMVPIYNYDVALEEMTMGTTNVCERCHKEVAR